MRAQTQVLLNSMSEGQKAGLAAFYNQSYHYALYVTREQGRSFVVLAKKVHDLEDTTTRVEIDFDGMIEFQIETGGRMKSCTHFHGLPIRARTPGRPRSALYLSGT